MLWCESCGYVPCDAEVQDEPGDGEVGPRDLRAKRLCASSGPIARKRGAPRARPDCRRRSRDRKSSPPRSSPAAPVRRCVRRGRLDGGISAPNRNSTPFAADSLQRTRNFVQSTFDVPSAELRLHIGNDVERGGRPVRRRAVVRGKAVEKLDQMRVVPEETSHDLVHRREATRSSAGAAGWAGSPAQLPPPFFQRVMQKGVRAQVVQPARVGEKPRHVGPLPERGVLVDHACRRSSGSGR